MDEKTFKTRTKKLAIAIIQEVDKLPRPLQQTCLESSLFDPALQLEQITEPRVVQSQLPI